MRFFKKLYFQQPFVMNITKSASQGHPHSLLLVVGLYPVGRVFLEEQQSQEPPKEQRMSTFRLLTIAEVLNLGHSWYFGMGRGCPVHCGIFSYIPRLRTLDDSWSPPPSCNNRKCLQASPDGPWGTQSWLVGNHWTISFLNTYSILGTEWGILIHLLFPTTP